ncbi:hypothetical protein GOP47_0027281 [Adiantum capillus-veneris]|nr:hypothetical protein GOP47_0027281 [Adiantum capillus-veneris]
MLCKSRSQRSPCKRVQHWENQNQFLQVRHGHNKGQFSEIILVGLRCDKERFKLLSWAIIVAARPGDTVIAFHHSHTGAKNSSNKSIEDNKAADSQLNVLKDLCELKQVVLVTKFAGAGNEELQLIKEASSLLATMVVVSPASRHELRNIQKTGRLLVQCMHLGCSIVIVKDYKILFYEQNFVQGAKDTVAMSSAASNKSPILRSKSLHRPLQRHPFCELSMSRAREKETSNDLDHSVSTGNKIWPDQAQGSPRTVFEAPGLSSESNISSASPSSSSSLTHSLSRKGILSCESPDNDDEEITSQNMSYTFSKLRRNSSLPALSSFPPASSCLKKLPGPVDCISVKGSFKTYINTLRSTESMSHDPFTPTPDTSPNWRCFLYEELAAATNDFSPGNMVGRGGHSDVYKGTLRDGQLVAIKRLTKCGSEERKEKDFLTELGIIGHVSHPNAIPLVGFCVEQGLHLIFNFSIHGSLATLLHGVNAPMLNWSKRYRVAVGTARGLHYLHTACPRRIIHRDIKASNILLGPEFEPQISDFGLAKWLPDQWTQLSVFPVEGTFGYLAPEYFMHGVINEKTDVFAFGVLLLELLTGQQPINKSQQSLVMWAKPLLDSSKIEELADPRLAEEYDPEEMQSLAKAARLCVQASPSCRPFMGQVLEILTGENCDSYSLQLSHSHRDSSEEYSSASYLSDLSRHREVALDF